VEEGNDVKVFIVEFDRHQAVMIGFEDEDDVLVYLTEESNIREGRIQEINEVQDRLVVWRTVQGKLADMLPEEDK
jgi:hypothetical protein